MSKTRFVPEIENDPIASLAKDTEWLNFTGIESTPSFVQLGAHRLVSGEYVRCEIEQYGRRVIVSLGAPKADDPQTIEWGWQLVLIPRDLATLINNLTYAAHQVELQTSGYIAQAQARHDDLEQKLAEARAEK